MRLTILILLITLIVPDAEARSLQGGITVVDQKHQLELKEQKAEFGQEGDIKEGSVVKQPAWIEGRVYTEKDLFMYSFWELWPMRKKFKWRIPKGRSSKMTFSDSIVKQWKGYMPPHPEKVTCVPVDSNNENFSFHHKDSRGPSGYFEHVGKTKDGFDRYRIWFNEQ